MIAEKKQVSISIPLELMDRVQEAIVNWNMRITPTTYIRNAVEDSVDYDLARHEATLIMENSEYLIRLLEREDNKNLADILKRFLLKNMLIKNYPEVLNGRWF